MQEGKTTRLVHKFMVVEEAYFTLPLVENRRAMPRGSWPYLSNSSVVFFFGSRTQSFIM